MATKRKTVWKRLGMPIKRRFNLEHVSRHDEFWSEHDIQQFRDAGDHVFRLMITKSGRHRVMAGCRNKTIWEYRQHTKSYNREAFGDVKTEATLAILNTFQDWLDAHRKLQAKRKAAARKKARASR